MVKKMKKLNCSVLCIALIAIVAFLLPWYMPQAFCQLGNPNTTPEQALIHKTQGDDYLEAGHYAQAITEYQKALRLYPHSATTYFNLAIAHYSQGSIRKAAQALEKLLELAPSDVEAHYNLACLNLYLQDIEKAKFHFRKAMSYRDDNPQFIPLIKQALKFLEEINKADTSTQDIIFFLLRQGLPPLSLTA
jgi:tetratricopeptide (TPR) repeat protein